MSMSASLPTELLPTGTPEEITAASKSNFSLSFAFLPKNRRAGMTNFYAFSRVIDDAVDDHSQEQGRMLMDFWKNEIELCYSGTPTHPITQAMQKTIREFNISQKNLLLLWEGCEMDLKQNRYETLKDLEDYCFKVASVIGLVAMNIFGLTGEKSEKAAIELGLALQLTNILRDIPVDAKIGRVYIPQEDLKRYKITEEELITGPNSKKLNVLLHLMHDRAETHYFRAFSLMKELPKKPLIAAAIMGKVYYQVLKKIHKKNYDIYSKKIKISKIRKITIALREMLMAMI